MRSLAVALLHREAKSMIERVYGPWSYPVPEFAVQHFPLTGKHVVLSRRDFAAYDLIVQEDGRLWIDWRGNGPPLAYVVTDSTLSEQHYRDRYEQARQADLVLVDWDRLERFADLGRPVRRLSYSVNDRLFRDSGQQRAVDVGVYMNLDIPRRRELALFLADHCQQRGWRLEVATFAGPAYAAAFGRTKLAVQLERTATTRAHRVFDALAAGCCLLTTPEPAVSGEERQAGRHYREWLDLPGLGEQIDWLLVSGEWQTVARAGYELVHRAHTWSVRARQLRQTLAEVFPWLSD